MFNTFFYGEDCRIDVDRESMNVSKFIGSIEGSGLSYFTLLTKFTEQVRNDVNVKYFTLRITNILV